MSPLTIKSIFIILVAILSIFAIIMFMGGPKKTETHETLGN